MKTLINILTVALFASMTIACGASTQVSDSAFVDLSSIPAVAPAGNQDGDLTQLDAEPRPAVTEVGQLQSNALGAAAVNLRNQPFCPVGVRGSMTGCETSVPRPVIQNNPADAFTAMPEMNQADSFGGQHMGGHVF